jgi:anti-anti-sigma factor
VVVIPDGALDVRTAPRLAQQLDAYHDADDVVVDCAGVDFCDSTGVRVIVDAWRRQRDAGGSLRLVNVSSPYLSQVLNDVGLAAILAH